LVENSQTKAKIKVIGKTHQGRDLKVVQILSKPSNPTVYIQSGLHAREHIAQATGAFLLYDLLINNSFVEDFNIHLLTMANPDGYAHSRSKGPPGIERNKHWRKNRKPHVDEAAADDGFCTGVDLNRNFGFKHGVSGTEMEDPCSEIYSKTPFSEKETRAIKEYVEGLSATPILGLDIHSFANKLLYPYGYARKTYPDNIEEIKELAEMAVKEVEGMTPISAAELGPPASGATDDWMRGDACIRFVYTFELPDFGQAFWPAEKHIWPTANQVRNSINVMLGHIKGLASKGLTETRWCDESGNGNDLLQVDHSNFLL